MTEDIDGLKMNTAIAALMSLVNDFYARGCTRGELETLTLLLSPFAPHLAEEMWELLGAAARTGKMAMQNPWPVYDEAKMTEQEKEIAVQINGKLRGTVVVPLDADQATVEGQVHANERLERWFEGMTAVKIILVKNKLKVDKSGVNRYNAIISQKKDETLGFAGKAYLEGGKIDV